MEKKILLFDFDGTIADTLRPCIPIINKIGHRYGIRTIHPDEVEALRDLTLGQLLQKFAIPWYKVPLLVVFLRQVQSELYKQITTIVLFPGMKEVLIQLHKKGYSMGIITVNSEKNVHAFLKHHQLNVFDFVYHGTNLLGKAHAIKRIIQKFHMEKNNVIYIGDEVRDIEACQKVGIEMVAVTWGYNSQKVLEKYNPQHLVTTPSELTQVLSL